MKDNDHGCRQNHHQGENRDRAFSIPNRSVDHEVVEIQNKEKEIQSPSGVGRFNERIGPILMGAHLTYLNRIHPIMFRILTG